MIRRMCTTELLSDIQIQLLFTPLRSWFISSRMQLLRLWLSSGMSTANAKVKTRKMISLSQLPACANQARGHSMRGTVFRPDLSGSGKCMGITGCHVCGSDDAENWLVEHDDERRKPLPGKSKNVPLGWKRR